MGNPYCLILLVFYYLRIAECGDWPIQQLKTNPQKKLCVLGCICPREGQIPFLDCSRKDIPSLPKMIAFAPETRVATFHNNRLQNISEDTFFEASRINELDLSFNRLFHIDDYTFRPFQSMSLLRLSHNNFTSVSPKILFGLNKLRVLELSHNALQLLPEGFFVHTFVLQELKLQFNKLHLLSNTIFQFLNHLEKLDLGGNNLMTLPPDLFRNTPRLQSLSLAENKFEHVPKTTFSQTNLLHSLDMSQNPIEILPSEAFAPLCNISVLYLNGLRLLSRIEKNAFANMTGLKMLSCSYNKKLNYFHPEAFGDSKSKFYWSGVFPSEQLVLRYNGLKSLPEPENIAAWSNLNYVDLRDNPWRCDCNIRWMRKLKPDIIENVRCESPFSVHGRMIGSLSEQEFVCDDHWMFSTIILMVTCLISFLVCTSLVAMIVCYKTTLGRSVRSKSQFAYKKFVPKKEDALDLDWDPTSI